MNRKKKELMTAGLVVVSIAIWTPQLLMGVVKTGGTDRPDVPNDGGRFAPAFVDEQTEAAASAGALEDGALPGEVAAPTAAQEPLTEDDAVSSQLQLMEQRSIARGGERLSLDELIGALGQRRAGDSQAPDGPVNDVVRPLPRRDALAQVARDSVVNAILFDGDDSIALLDGELVRVGDVLSGGVVVRAIAPRRVELELDGEVRSLGLPALRTRPRSSDEGGAEGAASAPAPVVPAPAPAATEPAPPTKEL